MKKFLLLCCFALPAILPAQSFRIHSETNGADVNGLTLTFYLSEADTGMIGGIVHEFEIENTSSSAKDVQFVRRQQLFGGCTSYFCNCSRCYDDTTNVPLSYPTIQPAALCSLSSHFNWDASLGTARIRYTVYDKDNPSDSSYVTLIYYCILGPYGIAGNDDAVKFSAVHPNPASQAALFDYSAPEAKNLRFTIMDICGKQVKEIRPENNEGRQSIDVAEFPAGLYFISMNGEGMENRIQRLVITH